MDYVYHLGAHRTASTFLQENLSNNLDTLRAQGIFYVNEEMPEALHKQRKTIRALCHPDRQTPPADQLAQLNADITRQAENTGARVVLISEQNRLGPAMHQSLSWKIDNPGFYPQAASCLRYMTAGLPLDRTRILLYSRTPETYLLSLYSEAIRSARINMDLSAFCRAVNFNAIDFQGLQQRLQAVDPRLDIKMRSFERIKLGAESYLRTFLRDTGADPAGFTCHIKRMQQQLDANQVEALRQISMRGQSKRWRLVKRLREQVLAYDPDPAYRLELPGWVRDSLTVTTQARDSHVA
ncbi:MAG: hypothetical protein NXH74_12405 [Rhodobacteraceae bacterium]|jgi:hypothetical protein|nr:hypothetical protein [Paracoccaceae bacterium]